MKECFVIFMILAVAESLYATEPPTQAVDEQASSPVTEFTIVEVDPSEALDLDVPYVPTPRGVVERMLEVAKVGEEDIVYDLGSGDGRIVITAVQERGAKRGVGIELDPARVREANENAAAANVTDRVTFRLGDIFTEDFSEATVVTMYLLPAVNLQLRPRLLNELEPGTRVVSHAFDMGDWRPDEEWTVRVPNGRTFDLNFWRIPANLTGTWLTTVAGIEQGELIMEIEQSFQMITGTVGGGRITEGRVDGHHVSFLFTPREPSTAAWSFTGELTDDTLSGTARHGEEEHSWKAVRREGTRRPLEDPHSGQ